jgi:hypothetical protein
LLPSPLARAQSGTEVSGESRTGGPMLQEAVVGLLPTPVKGDAKDSCNTTANRSPGTKPRHAGDTLIDLVHRWEESLSSGATTDPPSDAGKPSTGLRLNPSFVGWMMGDAKLQRVRARVDRSRLSALGDGVHVYLGQLVGEYVMSLER